MLAVFAIGAVASASASAHSYWVEGAEVTTEPGPAVEGTSGTSILEGEGLLTVECKKDTFAGTIDAEGESEANVKFTECSVVGAPNCAVANIEFTVVDALTVFKGKLGDLFEPETGFKFVAIKITGSLCAVKGTYEVKGKQQCELDANAEIEQVEHEIICKPEGSELTLGANKAKFTSTEKIKLSAPKAGQKWKAKA
jgi:hypothetical protein